MRDKYATVHNRAGRYLNHEPNQTGRRKPKMTSYENLSTRAERIEFNNRPTKKIECEAGYIEFGDYDDWDISELSPVTTEGFEYLGSVGYCNDVSWNEEIDWGSLGLENLSDPDDFCLETFSKAALPDGCYALVCQHEDDDYSNGGTSLSNAWWNVAFFRKL
jgi:hypothetical protein